MKMSRKEEIWKTEHKRQKLRMEKKQKTFSKVQSKK